MGAGKKVTLLSSVPPMLIKIPHTVALSPPFLLSKPTAVAHVALF